MGALGLNILFFLLLCMLDILHNEKLFLKMIYHFLSQKIKQNYVIWRIFFQTNVFMLQINFVSSNVSNLEMLRILLTRLPPTGLS